MNGQEEPPEKLEHDFGTAEEGTLGEASYVVFNHEDELLDVRGVKKNVAIEMAVPSDIAPHSYPEIRASLDTTGRLGYFEGNITILADTVLPIVLTLAGTVLPQKGEGPFDLRPGSMVWLDADRPLGQVQILRREQGPMQILAVENPSERFSTSLETVEEGKRWVLSIQLVESGPAGRASESVLIRTSSPNQPELRVVVFAALSSR
ncbi:MAG: hypothetical protein VYE73_00880 [Acidobacteriota bacterium]|nr:hypothetical protein [Acidobacteriota bacterium]